MKLIRMEDGKEEQWGPDKLTEKQAKQHMNRYVNGLNENSPQSYKVVEDDYELRN